MTLQAAITHRLGSRFLSQTKLDSPDPGAGLYDCVTFFISVYQACGILDKDFVIPTYNCFSKHPSEFQKLITAIEATALFDRIDRHATIHPGDLLLFSKGDESHHTALYHDQRANTIAHCTKASGVELHTLTPPLTDHLLRIYRPKGKN